MTIILLALWVISFFVTFLICQYVDLKRGFIFSNIYTFLNLLLCSIPIVNVAYTVVWWYKK